MAFSEVVGHVRPLSILRRALKTERVAHAYLFAGPDGLGKALVAWNFAKALLCHADAEDACEACEACRKVNHGNHPDVVGVEAVRTQISIEQIRDIQRLMIHHPLEGPWRIIIVDRAHDLTLQAANALLKVLEEPPEGNVTILIARSTTSLIPTIVSRCQTLHFEPLTPSEVARYLQEEEGWEIAGARQVSTQAQGNIRRALDLKDKPLREHELALVRFLGNLKDLSVSQVLECAQEWVDGGRHEARLRLECLQGILRDLVLLRLDCGGLDHQDLESRLLEVARKWSLHDLLMGWDWVCEGLQGIERNYNARLLMDHLLFRLHSLKIREERSRGGPNLFGGESS
jgi:DNA polymerase-3 subunit delta'